jgi:hypothetical protein
MLDSDTIQKLENISIEEKIETIYIILNSLKNELNKTAKPHFSPSFKVCEYSLGADISVDRYEIYEERNQE